LKKITQSQRKVKALGPTKPNRPKRNSQNGLRQTFLNNFVTVAENLIPFHLCLREAPWFFNHPLESFIDEKVNHGFHLKNKLRRDIHFYVQSNILVIRYF
jgi:hypothetical protein